jgi:hypothetical protein
MDKMHINVFLMEVIVIGQETKITLEEEQANLLPIILLNLDESFQNHHIWRYLRYRNARFARRRMFAIIKEICKAAL